AAEPVPEAVAAPDGASHAAPIDVAFPDGRADRAEVTRALHRALESVVGPRDRAVFRHLTPDPRDSARDPQTGLRNRVWVETWDGRQFPVRLYTGPVDGATVHPVPEGSDGAIPITLPDRVLAADRAELDLAVHGELGTGLLRALESRNFEPGGNGSVLDRFQAGTGRYGDALDADRIPERAPVEAGEIRRFVSQVTDTARSVLGRPPVEPAYHRSSLSDADLQHVNHLRVALEQYVAAED